ncbi:MAG: acyltransferase domain-containing protein, partial [Planctomycetes bacterium]|nr:acyltransferase domain-containing protein [Planctomycetota bacterium]
MSNQNHNSAGAHEPIAIVGMACLFPRAGSIKNYWRLIRGLEDAVTDVPESHWAIDSFYDDNPKAPDMTYCKRGAFLSDVDFDPTEYGIPPSILEATDTAQLLGLVTAKAALRDAGYLDREGHDHARTSVIMGVTGTLELVIPLGARLGHPHWRKALKDAGVEDSVADDVVRRISDNYVGWQENSFPGLLGNVVAGRIANRLDLKGTNCVVDAACASSLSAVHLAAMELATGKSDMVVTGGIDSLNDIFMFMCFSKTQALSPTGNARPFDSNADGTVIGEGCGVLVLKRQSDAERDGDTIHALLKSVGSASDGRSQSIYAPRPAGQAKALRDAYERAGVKPRQIGLVEAHGTGTKVGDAVEFEALKTVYTEANGESGGESGGDAGGEVGPWCAVGSVKSQIGHTKAAAGAASLIKTVIALRNRVLPGTIKVKSPSPQMTESDSPFYINTETRPWLTADASPRRAAVSSFGFGGSNFHAVLEEYPVANRAVAWDGSVEILAISAPDQKTLQDQITSRCKAFSDGVSPAEFAKQVYASRGAFDSKHSHRLLIVCEDASKAVELLRRVQERIQKSRNASEFSMPGAYYASGSASGKLAFVFPGQGSQYVGMAQGAACVFPEALDALELQPNGIAQPVGAYICPPPSFDIAQREAAAKQLRQTEVAQPALAVTELAYLRILKRFDVSPSAVAGHSFGELVALRAAGRMDDATLCRLAKIRGELMQEGAGDRGTMLVVHAAANAVADLLAKEKIDAVMGNRNAPRQVVLSGPTAGIEDAANACRQRGWEVSRLDVSGAFHSRLMGDAAKKFRKVLDGIEFHPATIDVYANRSAGLYPESKDTALDVLAGQLDSTVRFDEQIEAMYASGVRTFLEVGPKRVLSGLIGAILGDRSHKTIAVDESNSRKDGVFDLACSLAQLAAMGHQVDLSQWEDTPPVVREPKMSIPICGANYRAPRKALPPSRKVATQTPTNARPAVSQNAAVSQNGPASFERNAMQQSTHQQSTGQQPLPAQPRAASPTPVPATAPTANVAAPLHLQEMYRVVGEGIRAMQSLQEQTANAHERFLETQSEAQRSFQKVIQSQQQMFGQIGRVGTVAPAMSDQHAAPAMPPPVQMAPEAPPATAVTAPVKATPPPVVDTVVEERAKQPSNVAAILLDVVSELTGYPTEMIEVDMDLEADLGIDSIKRVEILASVQERLPNLQTIDSSQLGSLRTLKDILSEIEGPSPDGSSPVPEQVLASDSGSASDIQGVLLDVVAELTGYPVEMLDVTMDLEADLGIDSIKRVEILAAVQARQPGLEEIDSSELGSLRTLDDILRQLGSEFSTNNS